MSDLDSRRLHALVDYEGFWLARGLELKWRRAPGCARGRHGWHGDWFPGGVLNMLDSASLRVDTSGDDWSDRYTRRIAAAVQQRLRRAHIGPGDRVALMGGMTGEMVAALWACVATGVVVVPMFSALSDDEVRRRCRRVDAKAVLFASSWRGRSAPDAGVPVFLLDALPVSTTELSPVSCRSEQPWMVGFTSGTSGRPKPTVHSHAGWAAKVRQELVDQWGVGPESSVAWCTDPGWVMFPWLVTGGAMAGAEVAVWNGPFDGPAFRAWAAKRTHLGVSPSLVRHWKAAGFDPPRPQVAFGSTGEPWDAATWEWLESKTGLPIVNLTGGTEVGTNFLSPHLGHDTALLPPASVGGPSLGMDVDILRPDGTRAAPGEPGELVCRRPWPGMARGVLGDRAGLDGNLWTLPSGETVWRHGDRAMVDHAGWWFLLGRSDDVMNVAGKRVGPSEFEEAATALPSVTSALAFGVSDPVKGERPGMLFTGTADPAEVADAVVARLGAPFRPVVQRVESLPTGPSGKPSRLVGKMWMRA